MPPRLDRRKFRTLKEFRLAFGLSQARAAALVPMSQAGWHRYESGRTVFPDPALAKRLSKLTGIPYERFLSGYFGRRRRGAAA